MSQLNATKEAESTQTFILKCSNVTGTFCALALPLRLLVLPDLLPILFAYGLLLLEVVQASAGAVFMQSDCMCYRECVALIEELNAPVKHIILTTHAYEHKIFISPFQRRFPAAQVYVPPE